MATNKYVVKRGDTWETIANKLGKNASVLAKKNNKVAKLVPGMTLHVPGSIQPQSVRVGSSGTGTPLPGGAGWEGASGGGGGAGGTKYKKTEKGYQYKYNAKTGRDHEQGEWYPTTAYNAWQKEKDTHFVMNPKTGRWETRKGAPVTPGWNEKSATTPYGGAPPPNWAHNYKYYVNAEKGQYWYWDEYDWTWKLNKKSRGGSGGGGGGGGGGGSGGEEIYTPPERNTTPETYGNNSIYYPEGRPAPTFGFRGIGQVPMASVAPTKSYVNPQYVGLVNWRF